MVLGITPNTKFVYSLRRCISSVSLSVEFIYLFLKKSGIWISFFCTVLVGTLPV